MERSRNRVSSSVYCQEGTDLGCFFLLPGFRANMVFSSRDPLSFCPSPVDGQGAPPRAGGVEMNLKENPGLEISFSILLLFSSCFQPLLTLHHFHVLRAIDFFTSVIRGPKISLLGFGLLSIDDLPMFPLPSPFG